MEPINNIEPLTDDKLIEVLSLILDNFFNMVPLPTYAEMAAGLEVSTGTVANRVRKLQSLGFIRPDDGGQRSRSYVPTHDASGKPIKGYIELCDALDRAADRIDTLLYMKEGYQQIIAKQNAEVDQLNDALLATRQQLDAVMGSRR